MNSLNDKLYTEVKGYKSFNWFKALNYIQNLPEGAEYDKLFRVLNKKSVKWVMCATGNLCARIPRYPSGAPLDEKLNEDGFQFYIQVKSADWKKAINTLKKIEKRAVEVLNNLD